MQQMPEYSDDQLVQGCLRKDSKAQYALYQKYQHMLFRVCLRYAKDRPEAEDMLQEGFIKIFRDLHQYGSNGALGGWLRRVMVNTALQHLRKQKKWIADVEIEHIADQYTTGEDVFARLGAEALTRLIQQLPVGYRMVFNLYVVEGYSHQEIADQLQVSVNTSKSQLSKAKATLRKMLEKIMVN